jgi:hypothetical protein
MFIIKIIKQLRFILSSIIPAPEWHKAEGWVAVQPEFNPLHGDPRFEEFVKKLNT